jgi:hypothetical protein
MPSFAAPLDLFKPPRENAEDLMRGPWGSTVSAAFSVPAELSDTHSISLLRAVMVRQSLDIPELELAHALLIELDECLPFVV